MTALIFNSGSATVAAGATVFIAQGYNGATEAIGQTVIGAKGTLRDLIVRADVAAGAGESYTYTIQKNGTNSTLTVTISGASAVASNDRTNEVAIDVGDRVTLKLVTSGAAAAARHFASLLIV